MINNNPFKLDPETKIIPLSNDSANALEVAQTEIANLRQRVIEIEIEMRRMRNILKEIKYDRPSL